MFPIEPVSLRLAVGTIRPSYIRTLIPIHTEPVQVFVYRFLVTSFGTNLIGVLNPQYERATVLPGEEPGKESGPQVANV